jgi:hypothetical protein
MLISYVREKEPETDIGTKTIREKKKEILKDKRGRNREGKKNRKGRS